MAKAAKQARRIPSAVRGTLWKRYFGPETAVGTCFICNQLIMRDSFEAGHFLAKARGGSDNLDNLRPVCRNCNASMGTQSIQVYKRRYYSKIPDLESYDPEHNPGILAMLKETLARVRVFVDVPGQVPSLQTQLAQVKSGVQGLDASETIGHTLSALEARLQHYRDEALFYLGAANVNPETLLTQAVYYYACALVDRCLAQHLVPVVGDADRLSKVRQLASVNPVFAGVYEALRNLEQRYGFGTQGYPVPDTIRELLADYALLVNDLIVATDATCPPPPPLQP